MIIRPFATGLLGSALLFSTVLCSKADTFGSGGDQFTINFVPIGNAGNANDTTGYGGVAYSYNMAVTDVSVTMLQDVVALTGTINFSDGSGPVGYWSGSQPASAFTWYQAAAFVNWMNTSQGYTAAYDLTYTGSTPTGITLWPAGSEWTLGGTNHFRNANAHYFLPSENEWYKAAYYDPTANNGAGGYWEYAYGSNNPPTAVLSGTAPGTAVYSSGLVRPAQPASVDQSGGLSPYGTEGQTGNIIQWMETVPDDPTNSSDDDRVVRGSDWFLTGVYPASVRGSGSPSLPYYQIGFRVASIPEPTDYMLILGGMFLLAWLRSESFKV